MQCVETPTLVTSVSVHRGSLAMEMWLVKQQRSEHCANQILTAQTMLNVTMANVCADRASLLQAHCVWMWMSADQHLEYVELMLSVSILWVASHAHVCHHLLAVLHPEAVLNHVRVSSVLNMLSARLMVKRLTVSVSLAGHMTLRTLLLDVLMLMSVANLVLVVITASVPTCQAATCVSVSLATLATPRSDVLT